jgi:hypothetical protein
MLDLSDAARLKRALARIKLLEEEKEQLIRKLARLEDTNVRMHWQLNPERMGR